MRKLVLLAALPLVGCGMPPVDYCKYAPQRRTVYTTAIQAADLYALSGRVVPYELAMGRRAAVTALAVLDSTCPVPDSPPG
jgi:hypothetical protein